MKNILILILLGLCGYLSYQKYNEGNICPLPESFYRQTDNGVSVYPGSGATLTNDVILYSTSSCPNCKRAKTFLESRGIKYTNYDIQVSKEGKERHEILVKPFRQNGQIGVPLIVLNGTVIYGFNENQIIASLK